MRWVDRYTLTLGRFWLAWLILLTCVVAIRSCTAMAPPLAQADPMAEHVCHLLDTDEWTAEGYVELGGSMGDDLVLVFRLQDGCTCVLYVPAWLEDPSTFPRHQPVILRGITLQEHPGFKPFAVVLSVGLGT
jgi:hypothetical protein